MPFQLRLFMTILQITNTITVISANMCVYTCMHIWFCLPKRWWILAPISYKTNLQMRIEPAQRVHCGWAELKVRTQIPLLPALWPWLDNFLSFHFLIWKIRDMNPHLYLIMFQRGLINSSCALCVSEFTIFQTFSSKTLEIVHPFVLYAWSTVWYTS